jgi:hypothetical protein
MGFATLLAAIGISIFAALPATTNYQLNSYGFGSGGGTSSTSNYSLEGITGETGGSTADTSTYALKPGYVETQQANVPKVTLTNPSGYYDKLHFVIDEQNNPSDALYALQVQTGSGCGDFASNITYVKSDNTLGASLSAADYQLNSAWAASGGNIIGLNPGTTYCIRAKATQGTYTESAWGPSSSSATAGQTISFCLYTSGSCAGGGNSVAFGSLLANTVNNAPDNIGVDFSTNADYGGNVYILSQNGGLKSNAAGFTISSASADLSTAGSGYGARVTGASQTIGSFTAVTPYDQSADTVGALNTSFAKLLSASSPLSGGSGTVVLKAKTATSTPAANDYADMLTIVAAASF